MTLGLVLRTLGALGIVLDAQQEGQETTANRKDKDKSYGAAADVDINSIVARTRKKRK